MAYDELRQLVLICLAHMMFPGASEVLGYSFFVKIVEHLFDIFQTTFSWLHLSLGLHLSEWRGKSCLSIWEIHDKLMRGKSTTTTGIPPPDQPWAPAPPSQHLVQQKGPIGLFEERRIYFERRNKSYFYWWWERRPTLWCRAILVMGTGHRSENKYVVCSWFSSCRHNCINKLKNVYIKIIFRSG